MNPGRGIEGKERAVTSRYPMGFMSYYYIVTGVKKNIIPPEPAVLASQVGSNRSKTSASFSSGVPNTEKQMKARRRRRSAFIVSRCLEPLMKNEARVFELASQMKQ